MEFATGLPSFNFLCYSRKIGELQTANCKLTTTGQGLMAGRPWAAGGLFGGVTPAQGFAIIDLKPLE
jgi:hypothetical protein